MFLLFDGSPTLSKHYLIFHLAFAMSIWLRPVPVTGILHKIQKKGHKRSLFYIDCLEDTRGKSTYRESEERNFLGGPFYFLCLGAGRQRLLSL